MWSLCAVRSLSYIFYWRHCVWIYDALITLSRNTRETSKRISTAISRDKYDDKPLRRVSTRAELSVGRVEKQDGVKCNSDPTRTVRAFIPRFYTGSFEVSATSLSQSCRAIAVNLWREAPHIIRKTTSHNGERFSVLPHVGDGIASPLHNSKWFSRDDASSSAPFAPWHTLDQIPSRRVSSWGPPYGARSCVNRISA